MYSHGLTHVAYLLHCYIICTSILRNSLAHTCDSSYLCHNLLRGTYFYFVVSLCQSNTPQIHSLLYVGFLSLHYVDYLCVQCLFQLNWTSTYFVSLLLSGEMGLVVPVKFQPTPIHQSRDHVSIQLC